jgi:tetratricopeptide (TPR) repeat protein
MTVPRKPAAAMSFAPIRCAVVVAALALILMSTGWYALPARAESNTALMQKAVEEYRSGDFADAAGNFYATLTKEFNNPMVHYYMASCYVHLEDPDSAVREFRIAYALAPNTDIGYYSKTALKYFVFNSDGSAVSTSKKEKKNEAKSGSPIGGSSGTSSGTSSGAGATTSSAGAAGGAGASGMSGTSGAGGGAGAGVGVGVGAGAGTTGSSDVIQSQAQREKESRLAQSAKLAEEINKQGDDRFNKAVSGLSSDPREREQQMLRLPDDVKSMLNNLRAEYDMRKKLQLEAGKQQADKLDESASNLQSLIDQHQSLQTGSNLYVRRYKQDAAADRAKSTKSSPATNAAH